MNAGCGQRARVAAAAVGMIGLVAGCVNQQHEVSLYRRVLDDHRPKPAPLRPGEQLTLERAMALANADNENLATQGENYLQTLIAKNRAYSAFLPTLSFQPNFTIEEAPRGPGTSAGTSGGPAGAPSTNAAAVAASQGSFVQSGRVLYRIEAPLVGDLSLAYRDLPLYRAANLIVVQQRQLLLDAQATLLLNVAQSYFQVLIETEQTAVLRNSVALQQARVRDLEGRLRMRLSLPLDFSQAQANEAATEVSLRQAENDARNARRMLALLIGAPQVDGPLAQGVASVGTLAPASEFVQRALHDRQDYQAAAAALAAARQTVKAAIAEYYPSLSISLAGYLYREDYSDASRWNGILAANFPLFSAGQIRADVRTAWSRVRQAGLLESYLRRSISEEVFNAYDNWQTAGVVLEDLRREAAAARDAYIRSVQLEKNGLAIPLDVLTAQNTLLNARLQFVNEAFNRTIFYFDLLRAEGDLAVDTPALLHWERISL